jgi:hypothetical protein
MTFSNREINSIKTVLRKHQKQVSANSLWRGLCERYGVGRIGTRYIDLSLMDRERIRNAVKRECKFDPMHIELSGDRLQIASITQNEKRSGDKVFGDQLVLASPGGGVIKTCNGELSTPLGTLVSVRYELLEIEAITTLVIVENGQLMTHWDYWATLPWLLGSHLIYRGHGENQNQVQMLVDSLSKDVDIICFPDFDPAGLDLALRYKPNGLIIPKDWSEWSKEHDFVKRFNKHDSFFEQEAALGDWPQRHVQLKNNEVLTELVSHLRKERIAITQEHLVANDQVLMRFSC